MPSTSISYDALRRRAEAGAVTGGRVFGYRHVRGPDGYVHRVIDAAEAATVRYIFTLYADSLGLTRLAKRLNAEQIPSPETAPFSSPATVAIEMPTAFPPSLSVQETGGGTQDRARSTA